MNGLCCALYTVPYKYKAIQEKYVSILNKNMISSELIFHRLFSQSLSRRKFTDYLEEMTKHFYPSQRFHLNCFHSNHKNNWHSKITRQVLINRGGNIPLSRETNKCHFSKQRNACWPVNKLSRNAIQ